MGEQEKAKSDVSIAGSESPATPRHPSKSLQSRARGYGIASGYEKPYRPKKSTRSTSQLDEYGPIPHSGYYGAGDSARPFKRGHAGYEEELLWYPAQYGEETSGYEPVD